MATKKATSKTTSTPARRTKAARREGVRAAKSSKAETRQAGAAASAKKKPSRPAKADDGNAGRQKIASVDASSAAILARAEEDMTHLLDSLNSQMSAAMRAFEDLAAVHRGRGPVVTRTRPIDRATAMFQRLVGEVLDDRFAEFLPTLVSLRVEMAQRAQAAGEAQQSADGEFFARGRDMLDQALASAEVQAYEPRLGDAFDPLIHLAVGETDRPDLAGDVVSEVLQNGYRSARGKVVQTARVKVNRR